jgi:hypothetical protein
MNPSFDLKRRVMDSVQRVPSPSRSRVRQEVWLVALATVVASLGLFFALDGVGHGAGRPVWFLASWLATWAAIATTATRGAWQKGASFSSASVAWLVAIAVGTPLVLQAFSVAFVWLRPELATFHADRVGLKCFALTVAAATCPLAGLSLVRRSSDPMHPVASGAALGVASGALAGLLVVLWCPVAAPMHVAVGHVLPIVALAMIGSVLGHHVMALRSAHCPKK